MTKKTKTKTEPTETPRLVALKIRNYAKIEAFDCEFREGSLTLFCADNELGKTTALSAIDVCLRGPKSKAMPATPVHDGAAEKDLLLELNLGTLIAKRTMVRGRWALDVRPNKKGAVKLNSGQAVLDELIGMFIDPREFDKMDRARRVEVLRGLAGLDFAGLDAKRAEYFAQRTDVGKDIKRLTGALEELPEPDDGGGEVLSVSGIVAEIAAREQRNDNRGGRRSLLKDMRGNAQRIIGEVDAVNSKIAELEKDLGYARERVGDLGKELEKIRADGTGLAAEVETMTPNEPTEDLKAQLQDAEGAAAKAADAKRWRELRSEIDVLEEQRETLTGKIAQADANRAGAITKAKYPIPGLEARDDGVYLDGLLWESGSESQRQTASTRIGFAMHPQLKAILIQDGSLFGAKARARLLRDAQECGGQIVMEIVSEDAEIVVRIEDGEVAP